MKCAHVEHAGKQVPPAEVVTQPALLYFHLDRLERLLMPLLDGDTHPELT